VILYDPWWNPAVEAQAIDRSHRIGQTRTVNAYRLIAPGTVEEKIWELQQRKAQAIADVLGEEGFAKSLSQADLEYLFSENRKAGLTALRQRLDAPCNHASALRRAMREQYERCRKEPRGNLHYLIPLKGNLPDTIHSA
jgi:hypothetical protein